MVTFQAVKGGIQKYLDNELLSKITGWQRLFVGAGLAMALDKSTDIFNSLKQNPLIQGMDIINSNDEVDIDTLYKYVYAEAQKGAVTFNIPLVGAVTFKADDVEKLYQYIRG